MSKLIGDKPNQVPTNADLGDLAYQNSQNAVIDTISNEFGVGHIRCVQVTIAEDSVAEVIPPRTGGFVFITASGDSDFPSDIVSGLIYYDVGNSLLLRKADLGASIGTDLDVSSSDLTGTTGVDGNVTISRKTDLLQIENRLSASTNFQLTFV